MAVAHLFRSFLQENDGRARLLQRLNLDTMPVIVPALGDTLASHIREAVARHFGNGEQHAGERYIIVPECLFEPGSEAQPEAIKLCVLIVSAHSAETFWQVGLNELHDSVVMSQVLAAPDPDKKWDVAELNAKQRREFKELADFA